MDRDQDFLAGIGQLHQFAQPGLGFSKGRDHVTTVVLFLIKTRGNGALPRHLRFRRLPKELQDVLRRFPTSAVPALTENGVHAAVAQGVVRLAQVSVNAELLLPSVAKSVNNFSSREFAEEAAS